MIRVFPYNEKVPIRLIFYIFLFFSLEDVDECALEPGQSGLRCAYRCVNLAHDYFCVCESGYRLNEDGHSCDGEEYKNKYYLSFHRVGVSYFRCFKMFIFRFIKLIINIGIYLVKCDIFQIYF